MWLASTRPLLVTLLLLGTAHQALAQNATTPQTVPGTVNATSSLPDMSNTTLYPEAVTPAPRLEPLLTPGEQASRAARRNAKAETTTPQTGSVPGVQVTGTRPDLQTLNTAATPQITQVSAPTPAPATLAQAQPLAGGTGNAAGNFGAGVSNAAGAAAGGASSGAGNAAANAASGAADAAGTIAGGAAAGAGAVAGAVGDAAGNVAEGIGASVSGPSNTSGFSSQSDGAANLPLNQGQMPNLGMNMTVDQNMVGGYDPNLPPDANANAVPYEVQLEQRTQEIREKTRNMAFEQAKKSILPMESYEIRDVLSRLKDTQEATQSPVRPAPTPGNVIRTISTDPAAKPKVIHLATGNVTTVNIIDITGEPWPIVDIGFGGAFDIKPPEAGGHVIRLTPLKDFARGNLVVRLLKMTTPITFSLEAGGDTVNYRFDARVPDYGPNAKMPIMGQGITTMAGDKVTTAFLEGTPPAEAEKLVVAGTDARTHAYRFAGSLYVRTPLSLLSPAWNSSATSSDGMNIYVLNDAPVLLLSEKGSLVRAKINDAKKSDNDF